MKAILPFLLAIIPLPFRATAPMLAVGLAALVVFGLSSNLRAEAQFVLPNLEANLFDGKKVDFGKKGGFDRTATIRALIHIAGEFDSEDGVASELRSHALGLAGMIDPKNKSFKATYAELKADPESVGNKEPDKVRLIGNIYDGVEFLLKDKDNEDNRKCAAYCVDVALRLDPESRHAKNLENLRDGFKADDIELEWDKIKGKPVAKAKTKATPSKGKPTPGKRPPISIEIPGFPFGPRPDAMKPREEEMPGGKADKFAATQSTIFGLVVRTLSGGKHAGAASELIVTALKEDVKGVHFKIDQKVGDMMANSLDSIVKYMRVKYGGGDKVPDGYEVSIVFEDRDTKSDGPSAGTAMALTIDSLFSGSKIDPQFACTGGITPHGKVTKIGGVAAKIRGATRRDCKIVGVPAGNVPGVNDILVLGGLQQLLDIQVFTMKDFDEAFEISRAEKDGKVSAVLSDFNKVAEVIRTKGEKMLENTVVQKKLQGVVDAMPNHVSAKLLLDYGKGEAPDKLSAGGSFREIGSRSSALLSRAGTMAFRKKYDHSDAVIADAKESLQQLKEINGHVHEKFEKYLKAAADISVMVEKGAEKDGEAEFLKELKGKFEALQIIYRKLKSDPDVSEEIMG